MDLDKVKKKEKMIVMKRNFRSMLFLSLVIQFYSQTESQVCIKTSKCFSCKWKISSPITSSK